MFPNSARYRHDNLTRGEDGSLVLVITGKGGKTRLAPMSRTRARIPEGVARASTPSRTGRAKPLMGVAEEAWLQGALIKGAWLQVALIKGMRLKGRAARGQCFA